MSIKSCAVRTPPISATGDKNNSPVTITINSTPRLFPSMDYYGNNTNLCRKCFEYGKKLRSAILIEHKNKEDERYGEACSHS
jgi:hypothetical protein